ncbi:hypothetical protein [Sporomusa sphaeroides]|nr:hypothetical protein [Sporomusa sphaeroides]HML35612.1 hypothetical protein [Sporomusa sphaeroides]
MAIIASQQGGEMTTAGFWLVTAAAACWGVGNVIIAGLLKVYRLFLCCR